MPINSFDKPLGLETQPFNWDPLFRMKAYQREREDKAIEDTYKLQGLIGNLKSATFDRDYKRELDNKYTPILNGITNKILAGDKSYRQDLIKAKTDFSTDPNVQLLQYNYDKEQDYLKDAQDYQKQSKFDPIYDTRDRFVHNRQGFTPFDYSGMSAKEDFTSHAEDLMKGIASDSRGYEGYSRDNQGNLLVNEYGQVRKSDGSWETISSDKLRNVARTNLQGLLSGKGGKYFVDSLIGQEVDFDRLPPEVKKKVLQAGEEYLYNTGYKYLFNKTKQGEDLQNLSQYGTDKLDNQFELSEIGKVPLEIDENLRVNVPGLGNPGTADIYPSLSLQGAESTDPGLTQGQRNYLKGVGTIKKEEDYKGNFTPEQEQVFEKAKKAFGREPQNDYQKAKLINAYLDEFSKTGVNQGVLTYTDPKKIERENHRFFGTDVKGALQSSTRGFKSIDGENPKIQTGKQLADEYGNKDKYRIVITGDLTPDNRYFPAGKYVQVVDNSGNVVADFAMEGSVSEMARNKVIHDLYQIRNNPTGQGTIDIGGKKYNIDYEPEFDVEDNPDTQGGYGQLIRRGERVTITDSKGNSLPPVEGTDVMNDLYYNILKQQ